MGEKRKQLDPGTILVSVWSQGSQNLLFGHPGAQVRVKGAARQVWGFGKGPPPLRRDTGHSGPLPLVPGFPSVCCLTCRPVDRHQMQENTLSAQEGSHRSNYSVAERFPPGRSGGQWKEKACSQSSRAVSQGPVSATVRGTEGH